MASSMRFGSWTSNGASKSWRSSKSSKSSSKSGSTNYRTVCANFNRKIESYRTLCTQATGPASRHRPTPAALNSLGKWIDKGAIICRVSSSKMQRWNHGNGQIRSSASAKSVLISRFGRGAIKAVTLDKSGSFLVACAPMWKGKSLNLSR